MSKVYRLHAYEYTHVLDNNTCNTFTLVGPISFTLREHHHVVFDSPKPCVVVPPNHYVVVTNPVVHEEAWKEHDLATSDSPFAVVSGAPPTAKVPSEAKCLLGRQEVRLSQKPFPLFPGEAVSEPQPMPLLTANEALVLEVVEAFEETVHAKKVRREALDRFLFLGPALYTPDLRVRVVDRITATNVGRNQALHLCVQHTFTDTEGKVWVEGTQWTEKGKNTYFIHPNVELVNTLEGFALDERNALKITALEAFHDAVFKTDRKVGDEWLVTEKDVTGAYIPSHMEKVTVCSLVCVGTHQYCVVLHPTKEGNVNWGKKEIRKGPCSFFLQPAERLLGKGICDAFVLTDQEALLVVAKESFVDGENVSRDIGTRWLIRGPCRYIPTLEVKVLERRHVIPLTPNCGVYVRNIRTGVVTSRFGTPFMLREDEELWGKPVSPLVRRLLAAPRLSLRTEEAPELFGPDSQSSKEEDGDEEGLNFLWETECEAKPDRTDNKDDDDDDDVIRIQSSDISPFAVVTARAEKNTLIRLHDVSKGSSRVVAGPAEVTLEPYEEFTTVTLSGGRPKTPNQIHCLCLYLGPDYMADWIEIETLDHARLRLQLAYNWEFDGNDPKVHEIAFTIPDFIGEACKTLASRVRSLIAGKTFDDFHRNSSTLIKQAIFGMSSYRYIEVLGDGEALYFTANGLRITNVDVQSVEPVDPRTRLALTKSVQLAVEIITKSQENDATHNAMLREQKAKGALELQSIKDRCSAEEQRIELSKVMVENTSIEQVGSSKAQALAESEARLVEANSDLEATPVRCAAHEAGVVAELEILEKRMNADLEHRKNMNDIEVEKVNRLNDIEASKYESIMNALGKETVTALAQAGPELQTKLLSALGLQGFLVTDGTVPVNLMNAAERITMPSPP